MNELQKKMNLFSISISTFVQMALLERHQTVLGEHSCAQSRCTSALVLIIAIKLAFVESISNWSHIQSFTSVRCVGIASIRK